MSEELRPRLPWETRAAVGALALLSLQELHEVYLVCVGDHDSALNVFGHGSVILLLLFLGVLTGLLQGSRTAWWLGLILIGGIGLLHLAVTWHTIRSFLPGKQQEDMKRIGRVIDYDYEWVRPSHRYFKVFWVTAKSVLLLSVPVALLSGKLRERLRRS